MSSKPFSGNPYTLNVGLYSQSSGSILKSPDLESGDVKISTDGGPLVDLSSLPTVVPANSGIVQVNLTGAEVGQSQFTLVFEDQNGSQWRTMYVSESVNPAGSMGVNGFVYEAEIIDSNTIEVEMVENETLSAEVT